MHVFRIRVLLLVSLYLKRALVEVGQLRVVAQAVVAGIVNRDSRAVVRRPCLGLVLQHRGSLHLLGLLHVLKHPLLRHLKCFFLALGILELSNLLGRGLHTAFQIKAGWPKRDLIVIAGRYNAMVRQASLRLISLLKLAEAFLDDSRAATL